MYSIGLTGNIASGKSTAARYFKSLGVDVISADAIARELTATGQAALKAIQEHFGDTIIDATGQLDRAALRQKIFADPEQRRWLEGLLHPLIKQSIHQRVSESSGPYCVVEIPLLRSKADYPYLNRVLVLLASQEKQIARVIARDHCDKAQALAILATQPDDQARRELADDLIINSGTLLQLEQQIKKLHTSYLRLARRKHV